VPICETLLKLDIVLLRGSYSALHAIQYWPMLSVWAHSQQVQDSFLAFEVESIY